MSPPSPHQLHPIPNYKDLVFLNQVVRSDRIIVGDYTYFDDPSGPEKFETRNVLYHFDFVGDKLIIGKYCSLARDIRFIMNGGNHSLAGFSSYPFFIMGHAWENIRPPDEDCTSKGDTIVGNDVWIGAGATIMPGVTIGDGSVVGACSVVTSPVEPYSIVGGNPARLIRKRFDERTIARLLEIAWWNWPVGKVTANLQEIVSGNTEWLYAQNAAE